MQDDVIQDAMWAYVSTYHESLMRKCLKAAYGDENYAEELFHDEVLELLPKLLSRWDGVRSFHTYASSSISLHLIKVTMKHRSRQHASIDTLEDCGYSPAYTRDDEEALEVQDTVRELLDRLEPMERLAIVLNKMQNLSYREIAKRIGVNHNFVGRLINSALEKLRE